MQDVLAIYDSGEKSNVRFHSSQTATTSEPAELQLVLDEVCALYWRPLHALLLRQGHSPEDSEDLTQEFFARLIEKNWLAVYNPASGQLQSFLFVLFKRFETNEWHRTHRQKRGGRQTLVALDALDPVQRAAFEPIDTATPDKLYDLHRATAALVRVIGHLRAEAVVRGTTDRFEILEPILWGERIAFPYAELAQRFGTTENAIKSWVRRLRRKLHVSLCAEIPHAL